MYTSIGEAPAQVQGGSRHDSAVGIEFAAVVTRSRFVDLPLTSEEAARVGKLRYRSRRLAKIYPTGGTVMRAIREGSSLGISGPAWYDLFLAMTMQDAGVDVIVTEKPERLSSLSLHYVS